MDKLLEALYDHFHTPRKDERLKQIVEDNHQELIATLSKEDRKKVLAIIDAQNESAEIQSIDSFVQGFRLATQLGMELTSYGVYGSDSVTT